MEIDAKCLIGDEQFVKTESHKTIAGTISPDTKIK